MHVCRFSFAHAYIHFCMHRLTDSLTNTYRCMNTFMHSCIHSFIHSVIQSFSHSVIHSFIHTYIHNFLACVASVQHCRVIPGTPKGRTETCQCRTERERETYIHTFLHTWKLFLHSVILSLIHIRTYIPMFVYAGCSCVCCSACAVQTHIHNGSSSSIMCSKPCNVVYKS